MALTPLIYAAIMLKKSKTERKFRNCLGVKLYIILLEVLPINKKEVLLIIT